VYLSAAQFPQTTMTLVVRTGGDAEGLGPSMRTALMAIDPTVPLYEVRSLSDFLGEANASAQITTTLTAVFAMLALLLAAVGVYGVVSYAVEQRTDEMSVRIAVGATPAQVVLLMVRTGMLWSGVGIGIGLLAASWLGRLLATLLFEVREDDPATFISVGLVLATVALSACYIPARRASRVDALATLRSG
jgi:ABC-type antimicrobial peptide transport system permease subunit